MGESRLTKAVALFIGAAVVALSAGCRSLPSDTGKAMTIDFDFDEGHLGFVAGFADYPPAHEEIYELTSGHRALPAPLESQSGLFISGVNRSDDLFMFFKGPIDGLTPGASYGVEVSVEIATSPPAGCFGVGGAPGESVWIKASVTTEEPVAVMDDSYLRMNIDIGNQSNSGTQAVVLGNVANSRQCEQSREWELKGLESESTLAGISVPADGRVWLLIGVDSGFESRTEVYFTRAVVTLVPGSGAVITGGCCPVSSLNPGHSSRGILRAASCRRARSHASSKACDTLKNLHPSPIPLVHARRYVETRPRNYQRNRSRAMASAEQLKALLRSHLEGDNNRFISVAMQVAAHEARLGHGRLATDLRDIIDEAKSRRGTGAPVPIGRPRGELANLLDASYPKSRLGDMILGETLADRINRVIPEQRHAGRILDHGLSPRRKLLLVGPPGTGKTLTASVLAGELGLPLLQVRLDGLITRFMGETAAKLRQIFDATDQTRGVYFFDEFDAIGSERAITNDVGEIRRVLNSFLQMIEQDRSHSMVIAATNHPGILDRALFRRFDDILHFVLPDASQIAELLKARLARAQQQLIHWSDLARRAIGLSYAEVARAADDVIKDALVSRRAEVREEDIRAMLDELKATRQRFGERRT